MLLGLLLVSVAVTSVTLQRVQRADAAEVLRRRFDQAAADLRRFPGRLCGATNQGPGPRPAQRGVDQLALVLEQCLANSLQGPQVTVVVVDAGTGGVLLVRPEGADYPSVALRDYLATGRGVTQRAYIGANDAGDESVVVLERYQPAGSPTHVVVQLSESTRPLVDVQNRVLWVLGLASAGLLLLALVTLPLLVGHALRPLHRVSEAAAAIASGDMSRRVVEPARRDELGLLARSFNLMASAVQDAVLLSSRSEARMRQFVADASHELRTPLTTIQGQLDLVSRGASTEGPSRERSLEAMRQEAHRMSALVEDLMLLTRLEGGPGDAGPAVRQAIDLAALVDEVIEEQAMRAPEQVAEYQGERPAMVVGEREQLRRALLNLAQNALKYAPGGTHTWSAAREGDMVVLRLSDLGPGVPEVDLGRVFDRFYRGRAPETGVPGSGLGLAIVRSIVEAAGGTVGVENNHPGPGTTFSLRLPAG